MANAEIDRHAITTTAFISRADDGGVDVLRQLHVDVECLTESDTVSIGGIIGWIGFEIGDEDMADVADAISYDAGVLGAAAADIMERTTIWPRHALLLQHIGLNQKYRGLRLTGEIVQDLMALLRLDRDETLVLFQPEPQRPEGGPYDNGPERDTAMSKLHAAYRASGFQPWRDTLVWWLPIEE